MNDNELRETTRDSNKQNYQHDGLVKSYLTEEQLKKIDKKIKKQMEEVVEFATTEPLPSEDELYTDIYKN